MMNLKYEAKALSLMSCCPSTIKASSPSKISLRPGCSFDLPPGPRFSCPGATKACENCYAMKKRSMFSNVMARKISNWKGVKKIGSNVDRLAARLNGVIAKDSKCFRIHSSGDYASQSYIDAWTKVIESRPEVKFWSYTRSFKFNYTKLLKLPNFTLFASTDQYNTKEASKFVKRYSKFNVRHAYGPWEKDWAIPSNTVICAVTSGKLKNDGACEKCKLCLNKSITKNVLFLRH